MGPNVCGLPGAAARHGHWSKPQMLTGRSENMFSMYSDIHAITAVKTHTACGVNAVVKRTCTHMHMHSADSIRLMSVLKCITVYYMSMPIMQ